MILSKLKLNNYISEIHYLDNISFFAKYQDKKVLVVCDNNTVSLIPKEFNLNPLVLPAGEQFKNWESINLILQEALNRGLARDCLFVGLGGGVITDMTAFAASIYLRGVALELVPTTLLAMVDAAIGGKTGMDFMNYKNMVGTFYPGSRVLIYPFFVKTLTYSDYTGGLAEVIKSAMLGDNRLLEFLFANIESVKSAEPEILPYLIKSSVLVKARVVNKDFYEKNIRAFLNLGHTFAHALESVVGFDNVSHGHAVAWGLVKAMQLGSAMGITDPIYAKKITSLIVELGYKLDYSYDKSAIYQAMRKDKKVAAGSIRFILQKKSCKTLSTRVSQDLVLSIL
ncbi:MAG: 3-dehydroquinate synthase [Spirochaetales bacterium]|nr:3-dehydroquinate synthase [Spirochaetales bacterium]